MAKEFVKIDAHLDTHPKILAAGPWGSIVFQFLLRANYHRGFQGDVPGRFTRPEYLAASLRFDVEDMLGVDPAMCMAKGIEKCVQAELLEPTDDGYRIVGWGAEWGAMNPSTERSRRHRKKKKEDASLQQLGTDETSQASQASPGDAAGLRKEKKRKEEKRDPPPPAPPGVGAREEPPLRGGGEPELAEAITPHGETRAMFPVEPEPARKRGSPKPKPTRKRASPKARGQPKPKLPFTAGALTAAFKRGAGPCFVDDFDPKLAKPINELIRRLDGAGKTLEDVEAAGCVVAGWSGDVVPVGVRWLVKDGNLFDVIAKAQAPPPVPEPRDTGPPMYEFTGLSD